MAKLKYLGHASVIITSNEGKVCYVDPFAGDDYKTPADLCLVTHEHYDHNDFAKIEKRNPGFVLVRSKDMLKDGVYFDYSAHGFDVRAVPAYNSHHDKKECVGYLIEVDGVKIYHAGDTGRIPEMKDLAKEQIDYALLPIDGFYTMTPDEATKAADLDILPKHLIPIHMKPGMLWDYHQDMMVTSPRAMFVRPGDEIILE